MELELKLREKTPDSGIAGCLAPGPSLGAGTIFLGVVGVGRVKELGPCQNLGSGRCTSMSAASTASVTADMDR